MFEIIFLVTVCIYFIQSFIFLAGAAKKYSKLSIDKLPSVSVIVAARNEEENIIRCLESLNNLKYDRNKIEFIIVNDKSTDRTGEMIDAYIQDKPLFRSIVTGKTIGHLKGKTNALANALEIAQGEIILTTDADCAVPANWAQTIASYYTPGVGMVCGFTTQESNDQFTGMQSLDFIYLLTVAAGSMNLGFPLSCIGNNMSYRKSVYTEVGGYESIPFSITEDFKLLHTIFKLKKHKIIYSSDPEALVISKPCMDWKTLYWQKKRWGVGGLDSDLKGFLVMGSGFIAHLCMLAVPFFFSFSVLNILLFKLFIDYFFLLPVLSKFGLRDKMKYFFSFELYFILYVLVLPMVVLPSRKVIWKGRSY